MKIKILVQSGKTRSSLDLDGEELSKAIERTSAFLTYAYGSTSSGEAKAESKFKPEYVPEWLGNYNISNMSQKEKVFLLLEHTHPFEWVRSQNLKTEYEDVYGEQINLSSISTYLARFFAEGALERKGSRAQREYKLQEATPVQV